MSDEDVKKADDVVLKWGRDVAGAGFAQVPNYLLRFNQFTSDEDRLSPTELLLLIELAGTWWKKDDLPFPSMKTLAVRCGTSERQILRAVKRLEEIPLLQRVNRKKKGIIASNAYDLSPLVEVLQVIADTYPPERRRKLRDEQGSNV
ncbi:helix-turn-helix domain-containing protein [uncultured Sulfitobacter sp.]|uniref:helix-turn-helix domain-containing protein n=1 Tax=Phaeobacter sp. JH20_21 TaxID=3112478 RepID=UPI0025952EE5|nr:helix-turn-helix domain-containing protein [uncultured Sulfitobacter sp.]